MGIVGDLPTPKNLKYFTGTLAELEELIDSYYGLLLVSFMSSNPRYPKFVEGTYPSLCDANPEITIIVVDISGHKDEYVQKYNFDIIPHIKFYKKEQEEQKLLVSVSGPNIDAIKLYIHSYK